MWVVQCWDHVVSDLSVLHRVSNVDDLTADQFWLRVTLLGCYPGAVAAWLSRQSTREPTRPPQPRPTPPSATPQRGRESLTAGYRDAVQNPALRTPANVGGTRWPAIIQYG